MITQKARDLRKKINKMPFRTRAILNRSISKEMINELILNCRPTEKEFDRMTRNITIDGGDLFRLIIKIVKDNFPQDWRRK